MTRSITWSLRQLSFLFLLISIHSVQHIMLAIRYLPILWWLDCPLYCTALFVWAPDCRVRVVKRPANSGVWSRLSWVWINGFTLDVLPMWNTVLMVLFISLCCSVHFYRILTRDIDIANLSVCLSVCPSVRNVPVSDENDLTHRHSFSPYGSPIILFSSASNICSDGVTFCGGAKYMWGIKISRFSTNKSLYLANDARYRHSYYGRWIGARMRSIKWCHFHWPWTNPNPDFKITILFNVKKLENGTR